MLTSMAYLDQILPVSSTVEAVEVTRRASMILKMEIFVKVLRSKVMA